MPSGKGWPGGKGKGMERATVQTSWDNDDEDKQGNRNDTGVKASAWDPATGKYLQEDIPADIRELMGNSKATSKAAAPVGMKGEGMNFGKGGSKGTQDDGGWSSWNSGNGEGQSKGWSDRGQAKSWGWEDNSSWSDNKSSDDQKGWQSSNRWEDQKGWQNKGSDDQKGMGWQSWEDKSWENKGGSSGWNAAEQTHGAAKSKAILPKPLGFAAKAAEGAG